MTHQQIKTKLEFGGKMGTNTWNKTKRRKQKKTKRQKQYNREGT